MKHLRITVPFLYLALAIVSCGGSSPADLGPGGMSGPPTVSTGPLTEGVIWELNRPIDITMDRAVNFASVNILSVVVQRADGGPRCPGTYGPALDRATGLPSPNVIRFQPTCPIGPDDAPGFLPGGLDYELVIRGSDTVNSPLLALDGTVLETTLTVGFVTPSGTNPGDLFFDTVPGPPALIFRGRPGVTLEDLSATRFEIGRYEPAIVQLRDDGLGALAVDPNSQSLVPFGLPLNHYLHRDNQVALVAEFDQPVSLRAPNLERIHLEYESGGWRTIPSLKRPLVGCGPRGSTVEVRPLGTLPPGAPLRVTLDSGFEDLAGQSGLLPSSTLLPLHGTTDQGALGARVDAIYESFQVGGDEPGSMEDLTSDLGAPRGTWDRGRVFGVEVPGGVSRIRSKWYPVGLAGHDGAGAPVSPTFYFTGTDPQGAINVVGDSVDLAPPVLGPLVPTALGMDSLQVALTDLVEPTGMYAAQPYLGGSDRARLFSSAGAAQEIETQIFSSTIEGSGLILGVGAGCYAPGFALDCVPWDLASLFPAASAPRLEIRPQSFEVYTWITRDYINPDHRVTITFDAAMAAPDGSVDESSAYSVGSGWTPDATLFSGTEWSYVRFEVQFELDVSGDGYNALERSPVLDFIKIPVDLRR